MTGSPRRTSRRVRRALAEWWARQVCGIDPDPRYSRLDRLDGLRDDDDERPAPSSLFGARSGQPTDSVRASGRHARLVRETSQPRHPPSSSRHEGEPR